MINEYLNYLHEDKEQLNEVIMLALFFILSKIYKKYVEHKKIAIHCVGTEGTPRKKCLLVNKMIALKKTITEIKKLKSSCKLSGNPSKCHKTIDKKVEELTKEIVTIKNKLANL